MFDLILEIRYLINKFSDDCQDKEVIYKLKHYFELFNKTVEDEIKQLRKHTVDRAIQESRILEAKIKGLKEEKEKLIAANKSLKTANAKLAHLNIVAKKNDAPIVYQVQGRNQKLIHENNLLRYQLLALRNTLNKLEKTDQEQLFKNAKVKKNF